MLFTIGGSREKPALLYGQQTKGPKVKLGPGDYAVYHNQVEEVPCLKLYTQRLARQNYRMVEFDYNHWKDLTGRGVVFVNVADVMNDS
jgi:hypothetical protein